VQAESIVDALERFFLDIVGTVIPGGAALLAAAVLFFGGSIEIGNVSLTPWAGNFNWIVFIFASYAAGHAMNSFGERILIAVLDRTAAKLKGSWAKWLVPGFVEPEAELVQKIFESAPFKALMSQLENRYHWAPAAGADARRKVRDLRDVAMTIAKNDRPTVVRFRFLSMLNLGLASVLLLAVVAKMTTNVLHQLGLTVSGGSTNWWLLAALVVLAGFFLERRYMLYGMSQRVPFPMAIGELLVSSSKDAEKENTGAAKKH